jgi:hypothetical protein
LDHDLDAFPAYAGEETEMLTDTYQSLPSPRVTLSDVSFLFCIFFFSREAYFASQEKRMERDVGRSCTTFCTGPCPTELRHRSGSGRKRKTMRVDAGEDWQDMIPFLVTQLAMLQREALPTANLNGGPGEARQRAMYSIARFEAPTPPYPLVPATCSQ